MTILATRTTPCSILRPLALAAFALVTVPPPALAQEAHGAIAAGLTAYGDDVAYGLSWSHSTKSDAIDAALRGCRDGGGTTCQEIAWFRNGCGALAVDQHGGAFGKSAISQDRAEARAMQSCEAAGGTGCSVAGSQCAVPGEQGGSWSGSERVLAASEADTAAQQAEQQAQAPEAQQEALTREQRVHVQRGLSLLGFEAGPADGIFGPRTRAAIWDWQEAKGLEATGFVTGRQAEALVAISAADDDPAAAENQEAAQDSSVEDVYVLREPVCTGSWTEDECWRSVNNRPDCHFYVSEYDYWSIVEYPILWSSDCHHGAVNGSGTLSGRAGSFGKWEATGEVVDGLLQGYWVWRYEQGGVSEGIYVDGKKHDHWVYFRSDGTVSAEGRYVDGKKHDHWVYFRPEGTVSAEGHYIDDKKDGLWVEELGSSMGAGYAGEGHYVNGERHGPWVGTNPYDGCTEEGSYEFGRKHGQWVGRCPADYGEFCNLSAWTQIWEFSYGSLVSEERHGGKLTC